MQAAWVRGQPNVWTFAGVRVVGNSETKVLQSTPQSSISYRLTSAAARRVLAWAAAGQAAGPAAARVEGEPVLAQDRAGPAIIQASLPTQPLMQPPDNQGCAGHGPSA